MQFCCLPCVNMKSEKYLEFKSLEYPEECTICYEPLTEKAVKFKCNCQYFYHLHCAKAWTKHKQKNICPICEKNNF